MKLVQTYKIHYHEDTFFQNSVFSVTLDCPHMALCPVRWTAIGDPAKAMKVPIITA